MKNETAIIVDFGGQYNQLIARRVREANVYCEIVPYDKALDRIKVIQPKGIIFTGGPASVNEEGSPDISDEIFKLGIPILAICYGAQLVAKKTGGKVEKAENREYGKTTIDYANSSLFKNISKSNICWMSHTDHIVDLPKGFSISASTKNCKIASMENHDMQVYCLQFHPEVEHTVDGFTIIKNFLYEVCHLSPSFTSTSFIDDKVEQIKKLVGDKKVICALSGGVDSSVAAVLVNKAIGSNLTCIFVDHGLLRYKEAEQVEKVFRETFDINLIKIDASQKFYDALKGVTDPERKRKIIGEEFIRIFEEEARKLGNIDYLVQGTIYPDVIESGTKDASVIKSHHNVGGLPEDMKLTLIEPLRELFKDEVRRVGLELGIPEKMIFRHPFPGPGLGIRVLGEVTKEKCDILRLADHIYREELDNFGLTKKIWQAFAILPDIKTVGVMGDERTYSYAIGLRAVTSTDGMTAEFYPMPYDALQKISSRIVNEVKGINRVVYDVTSKPPATIEWE